MSDEKFIKVVNTSVREVHPEWLGGRVPGAIEAQEKRGQEQLSNGIQLPKMIMEIGRRPHEGVYRELGILVEGPTFGDELFLDVSLPNGWKIVPRSDHTMWSDLMNEVGQTVANIFYKASFYDRGAFLRLTDLGVKMLQDADAKDMLNFNVIQPECLLTFLKNHPEVVEKMYKEDAGKYFDKKDVPDHKSYMEYIKETLVNDADQGDIAKRIRKYSDEVKDGGTSCSRKN